MSEHDDTVTERFVPMSGDALEAADAVGGCDPDDVAWLVQTALWHRQEAMDLREQVDAITAAARDAVMALDHAGFCTSSDRLADALTKAREVARLREAQRG